MWEKELCLQVVDFARNVDQEHLKSWRPFRDCQLADVHVYVDVLASVLKDCLLYEKLDFPLLQQLSWTWSNGNGQSLDKKFVNKMFCVFDLLKKLKLPEDVTFCLKKIPHAFFYAHRFFLKDFFKCSDGDVDYLFLANATYRYSAVAFRSENVNGFWGDLYRELKSTYLKSRSLASAASCVLEFLWENENVKGIVLFVTYFGLWRKVLDAGASLPKVEVPFDDTLLIEDDDERDEEEKESKNWTTTLSYNGEHLFTKLFLESLEKRLNQSERVLLQKILNDELSKKELEKVRYSLAYKGFREKVASFLGREDKVSKFYDVLLS